MEKEVADDKYAGFPDYMVEVLDFRRSLQDETDRGCALMVASLLDFKLEQLLRSRFVDDKRSSDAMLETGHALGTFSSRIDLAYLLGLIGPQTKRDLHLIRRIRNDFGHRHLPLAFTDASVRDRCQELFHYHEIYLSKDPRRVFIRTTMAILAVFGVDLIKMKHLPAGKDLYSTESEKDQHMAEARKAFEVLDTGTLQEKISILQDLSQMLSQMISGEKDGTIPKDTIQPQSPGVSTDPAGD